MTLDEFIDALALEVRDKLVFEVRPSGRIRCYVPQTRMLLCPIEGLWWARGHKADHRTAGDRLGISKGDRNRVVVASDFKHLYREEMIELRERILNALGLTVESCL